MRLLQTAIERAQGLSFPSAHVVTLVQLADNMLRQPEDAAATLLGLQRMTAYREQAAAALRAVTVCGPTQYAWLGRRSRGLPAALDADLGESERRRYLVSCLREELYCSFYCHGRPVTARWGEPQPAWADRRLLEALSRANRSSGSWEDGWTVERVDGGEVVVTRSRMRMRVAGRESATASVRPGGTVRAPASEGAPGLLAGVLDGARRASASAVAGVRVYWNVRAAGPRRSSPS